MIGVPSLKVLIFLLGPRVCNHVILEHSFIMFIGWKEYVWFIYNARQLMFW